MSQRSSGLDRLLRPSLAGLQAAASAQGRQRVEPSGGVRPEVGDLAHPATTQLLKSQRHCGMTRPRLDAGAHLHDPHGDLLPPKRAQQQGNRFALMESGPQHQVGVHLVIDPAGELGDRPTAGDRVQKCAQEGGHEPVELRIIPTVCVRER